MFADVSSQNVVGYGQANLNTRFTGVGPMFFTIGEDVTSIQNLVLKGVDEAQGEYNIAPITQGGNIPVKYYWWCGLTEYGVKDGWYTTDDGGVIEEAAEAGKSDEYLADIGMVKAEGLVAFMGDAELSLQGSGEVIMDDYTRQLNARNTGVANPFPVAVNLQSYSLVGVDEAQGEYNIAPITQGGNIPVKYYWWCGLTDYGVKDGWYITDDGGVIEEAAEAGKSDEYLADYIFKAGEAAVTFTGDAVLQLKIKNPIAK